MSKLYKAIFGMLCGIFAIASPSLSADINSVTYEYDTLNFEVILNYTEAVPGSLVITPFVIQPNGAKISQLAYDPAGVGDQEREFGFSPPLLGEYIIGFEISNPDSGVAEIPYIIRVNGTHISGTIDIAGLGSQITLISGDSLIAHSFNYIP